MRLEFLYNLRIACHPLLPALMIVGASYEKSQSHIML